MDITEQPRTFSMPRKSNVSARDLKKFKSMTLKERLRSTFIRKYSIPVKKTEEVIYGKMVILGDAGVGKTSIIHRFSNNYFTEQYTPTPTTVTFDVTALIECDLEENNNNNRKNRSKSDSLLKRTIKNDRSLKKKSMERRRKNNKVSRVIGVNDLPVTQPKEPEHSTKSIYKEFKFQLVDTTSDITKSSPIYYRAMVADAHGFLLVCSLDKPESIDYIKRIYEDIRKMRENNTVPVIIVANKCDLSKPDADTVDFENSVDALARNLKVRWCETSVADAEGFKDITEIMLNEMNAYDEEEEKERNLPDEYAFVDESHRHKQAFSKSKWKIMM